jgi:hypothetical protein
MRFLLATLLLCSQCLAVDAWPENEFALSGIEILSTSNGVTLVSKDSKPKLVAVGTVYVSTTAQEIKVEAEDAKRNRLEVVEVTTQQDSPRKWVIYGSGPTWIRVDTKERVLDDEGRLVDILWETWNDKFTIGTTPPDDDDDDPPPPEPEDESPFPGEGLRVLIVYELDELASYPASQVNVLYAKELRVWAQKNCVKDSTGTAGLRILDQDTTADTPTQWTTAMARPRDSMPWIIVGNGKTGYEGPLPQTLAETISLLEKFK